MYFESGRGGGPAARHMYTCSSIEMTCTALANAERFPTLMYMYMGYVVPIFMPEVFLHGWECILRTKVCVGTVPC